MKQFKGYKFRLYPTYEQEVFFRLHFEACRWIYNYFLDKKINLYKTTKQSTSEGQDRKELTILKNSKALKSWLSKVNAQSLQGAVFNLDTAFQNFFNKISDFPKFKSKTDPLSFTIPQNFKIKNGFLYLPKALKSPIQMIMDRKLPNVVKNCTISKTPSGKYYASFLCEEDIQPLTPLTNSIGIDLGLTNLITTSDGQTVKAPKPFKSLERKLKLLQRRFNKAQKNSKNRDKLRLQLARLHERIANIRRDFNHKLTKQLIDNYQVIILETLKVKNMMQNHCLAKSIQDVSWGEITRQLLFKAQWYGRTVHKIDQFYPSSKTCFCCKNKIDNLPLSVREWNCPNCNELLDRDVNAAQNILHQGLADLNLSGCGMQSDNKPKLGKASEKLKARNQEAYCITNNE